MTDLSLLLEGCFMGADNALDIVWTQTVLRLAFQVVAAGINDDDLALELLRFFLVENQHASRYAGVVEQRRGQANNSFDQIAGMIAAGSIGAEQQTLPDLAFFAAAK